MRDPCTTKSPSIQSVLLRLGLHTTQQQIVSELARYGIEASEDPVERVRIDLLKDTAQIRGHGDGVSPSDQRRNLPRKVPGRRR